MIPAGTTEVGTLRTASEESVVFQTTEDFVDPRRRDPLAYVVERDGTLEERRRRAGHRRSPRAHDQLPFGSAADGRRRPLPRASTCRSRGCCCRSRSTARRRAARASTPRTRRCAGRSPTGPDGWTRGRGARRHDRRLQLRQRHRRAAASATSTRLGADRRAARSTGVRCRVDSRDPVRTQRRRSFTHPPEISLDHGGADRRAGPGLALGARAGTRRSARATARPASASSSAHCPGPRARDDGRDARGAASRTASRLGALGAARTRSPRAAPDDTHFVLDLATRRGRARARRSAPPTAAGASTARCRPRARGCASRRYRHGGGRRGNVAPGTLTRAQDGDPGRCVRRRTRARARRRRRRVARERAGRGRRWSSARATGPSPPTTSSSSPARRHRASRAPSASRRETDGADPRPRPAARRAGRPAARARRAHAGRRTCSRRSRRYLDERRLIGTTVQLLPVKLRGRERRRQPPGLAEQRPRARRGATCRTRSTRTSTRSSAARRRARRRLGVRARAQPGRALRHRALDRGCRVREDPARLRDGPRDRQAGGEAGRHPHQARAARARRVRVAHRQGRAPRRPRTR